MSHTIIYPDAMMVHSQNTSSANTTMVCTGRFIVGTLLAVSQISTLTLDLVNRTLGILNVRHECGGNPTGIGEDGDDVVEDAHERHSRESDSVQDSRRRRETEPHVNENEDGGEVNVSDCRGDNKDGKREFAVGRHIGPGTVGGTGVETTASPAAALKKEGFIR